MQHQYKNNDVINTQDERNDRYNFTISFLTVSTIEPIAVELVGKIFFSE